MLARKKDFTRVENVRVVRTNVISFELVLNKKERLFAVGCYFLLSDKEVKAQRLVDQALRDKPAGSMLLMIGDLNANLDAPWSRREEVLAQNMGGGGTAWGARRATSRCATAATCGGGGPTGGSRIMPPG